MNFDISQKKGSRLLVGGVCFFFFYLILNGNLKLNSV